MKHQQDTLWPDMGSGTAPAIMLLVPFRMETAAALTGRRVKRTQTTRMTYVMERWIARTTHG